MDARDQEKESCVIYVERDDASKQNEKLMLETLNGMGEKFKAADKQRKANPALQFHKDKMQRLQEEIKLLNDIGPVEATGRKKNSLVY